MSATIISSVPLVFGSSVNVGENLLLPKGTVWWKVRQGVDEFATCDLIREEGGSLVAETYFVMEPVEGDDTFTLDLQQSSTAVPVDSWFTRVTTGGAPTDRVVMVWLRGAWRVARLTPLPDVSAFYKVEIFHGYFDSVFTIQITEDHYNSLRWCDMPPPQPETKQLTENNHVETNPE